ncbi:prepilin-type N-terminal cleavage/methylation domain-containing protein [Gemmatimonas sp.]|uniref:type IV pilus modification PilV family protein n=1 Tax=Gemmatimonas sp. TaxID=1962908 RepID=UPI003562931B
MRAKVVTSRVVRRPRDRAGFTLIETLIAMTILAGVILTMALGTTRLQRSIGDTNLRTRAQARADVQIGFARAWPTWSTLENLTGAAYNGTRDGLVTQTTVSVDTTSRRRIKRVLVTVTAAPGGMLPAPVQRLIAVAAP